MGSTPSLPSPQSLPHGDAPHVAAAYTMAAAAFVAAFVFVLGVSALAVFESVQAASQPWGSSFFLLFPLLGLVATVIVTPVAFAIGIFVWRWVVPTGASARRGGLGGVVTVLGTYLGAALVVSVLGALAVFAENVQSAMFFDQWTLARLIGGLEAGAIAGPVALVYGLILTWWITLPVGFVAGWRHQRRS
ncbi:hypothetical protein C440_09747 [Haloferax mucosum ATCC BAA-1512]|uniref:Uncharacterized protein n=1 Tax=Haloferax mucosum ATCC BAA-1512 TaxID=662479 RepID=M0IH08_9EURY|nr:hypothetical protein [Haloferax mucosum]ELZ95352.1 hypothetical protein C440_09747 [Haloferax mucosum ATCC BAA-1512]